MARRCELSRCYIRWNQHNERGPATSDPVSRQNGAMRAADRPGAHKHRAVRLPRKPLRPRAMGAGPTNRGKAAESRWRAPPRKKRLAFVFPGSRIRMNQLDWRSLSGLKLGIDPSPDREGNGEVLGV